MKTKYKYITELTEEELNERIVIHCLSEDGYRTILIKNSVMNRFESNFQTKYLNIQVNATLLNSNTERFFHIISARELTAKINHNFDVLYEYLFKKIDTPISEAEFSDLMVSLEQLFKQSKDENFTLQVGVIGELLTLLYFFNNGYNKILLDYHKDFFSKHDIEINDKIKIEIKSTTKETRIHRFSHNQLKDSAFDVYVASVLISIVEKGMSLYELFQIIIDKIINYEVKFRYYKLMNYCKVDIENQGVIFSYDNSINKIKLMKASKIPQINEKIDSGVSEIYYNSLCDFIEDISVEELINVLLT